MIWDLSALTADQRTLIERGLAACDFPWDRLRQGLEAQTGRSQIPVEFIDLTRWALAADGSSHIHAGGDTGHILYGRRAALGLAWYSGKVSIERTLNPELAIEVFLAEGAHMVDFFYMNDAQRGAIFNLYHADETEHGHGWFEETGNEDYWSWVGESFMSGFTAAYCPTIQMTLEPRQPWAHRTTPAIAAGIRQVLTPMVFYGIPNSKVYHKGCCWILRFTKRERLLWEEEVAQRRPCRLCRP